MSKLVIVDLDGTIANIDHRLHYIKQDKPDWDSFYAACSQDTPNVGVVEWLRAINEDPNYEIYIVSARRASTLWDTHEWLIFYDVPYQHLHIVRDYKDFRPDDVLKSEFLDSILRDGFEIAFVIDDRPTVCAMWREHGLKVFPVNQDKWA